MSSNKYYSSIDWMRLLAAVLVIAIHTSPLAGFNPEADFVLTRIVARVAVPFFFMATGYFTLSRYHYDNKKLLGFLKKTGLIYLAAVVAYLPLNLYNGYFDTPHLLPTIVKDLVFDGTLYHLWYLPASMLGMLIAWGLVQKLDYPRGLGVAALLYLLGVLGDSYYGLAEQVPVINSLYDSLFDLFDYTRNGIFFAPIFMMLGGFMAERKQKQAAGPGSEKLTSGADVGLAQKQTTEPGAALTQKQIIGPEAALTQKQAVVGLGVSFLLMLAEALLLHKMGWQRHDSMYVFLLPCMVFLFQIVLHCKGKKVLGLRMASLLIYLIHPMMIVAVRIVAKITHLQSLLVENSLVHFAAVCLLSLLFSFVFAALWEKYVAKPAYSVKRSRAYIELNLANLSHNAAALQGAMPPGCELMAVVKAEAYGHGAYEIATRLEKDGVRAFAVATIDEGIRLRRYGLRGDILILGFTDVHRAKEIKKYHLTQTLVDLPYAESLEEQGVPVRVHIAIDSGMHRLGFAAGDVDGVSRVFGMNNLKVEGLFTHLCCCESMESENVSFTQAQIRRFYELVNRLKAKGTPIPKIHMQSSYGLLNYPALQGDYVRGGISLYGVDSSPREQTALQLALRPVLAVKAKVILIRDVPKGHYVGYGRAYQAKGDSRIAILPIGYGDGFPRNLSCGKASVKIGEHIVPIVGRICMDQLAVDITDADGIVVGDTATLIDNEADSLLSAPYVAECSDSISNEIFSRLGARLPVVVLEDGHH